VNRALLDAIGYNNETDTLVLLGDLVAKNPDLSRSLETVKFARDVGAIAVRGNHDEAVIEWRGIIHRGQSLVHDDSPDADYDNADDYSEESWLDSDSPPDGLVLPSSKKWKGEHFDIARRLSRGDYDWLLTLPLTLHVRSLHTYFVHAGLLPEAKLTKARKEKEDVNLPLDTSTEPNEFVPKPAIESQLSKSAERAVLIVEQNRKAYNMLNMRGVRKNGRPTKSGKRGSPCKSRFNQSLVCNRTT
jgi:hypothetical protein